MSKERITRKQIEEEIEWTGNLELNRGWSFLKWAGEDDMKIMNKHWQKSEETDWKDFVINYCDWVATLYK